MTPRTFVALVAVALFSLAWTGPAGGKDDALPQDPKNVCGQLENGFRYIVREHAYPPGRLALFLHVRAGALNESDRQNGLAHFLEHMAFNGSKHFAPGTLIPEMNKLGMQFGADSNAHTSYKETVYKLFMPDAKEETIDKAMTIFADYAYGLLLRPEEVDKERKVILEEARARKSAAERIRKQWMRKVFEGTRIATHDVIGDEKQIAAFSRDEFADYWNTWYRPENMTLIVVGDVQPKKIVDAARRYFGSFKARTPRRQPPATGVRPVETARAIVLSDPEQVMGSVEMLAIRPARPPTKTYAEYRHSQIENTGTWLVTRRLRQLVDRGEAAFRGASVSVRDLEQEALTPTARATGEPADWNRMLEQLIVEVSRAVEHGFTASELDLARREMIADAERGVEREKTLDARDFVNMYSRLVGTDEPILSAQQRLDLLGRIFDDVKKDEVEKVFRENFRTRHFTYVLTMPDGRDGLKLPSPDEVLAAAAEAWSRKTDAPAETTVATSLVETLPPAGFTAAQTVDSDLNITTARFNNNVILHYRHMDYKKDEVLVQITLAAGELEETAGTRGLSRAAGVVFDRPATSRLDSSQIRDLMTGRKVSVRGGVGLDTVTVSISGSPSDLDIGMQLAYALLTDGKVEQAALDNWKKLTLQRIEMRRKHPRGQMAAAMEEEFYGGDVRLCELTPEQVNRITIDQSQERLRGMTRSAFIEAVIVGDVPFKQALKLAARYLGALPPREDNREKLDALRRIARARGPYEKRVEFETLTPQAQVMAGFIGCHERDVQDRRLLTMATRIISDRMVQRIREEEQLVYSIRCLSRPAREIPDTGMVMAAAPTDPENADLLADTILEMLKDFAAKGPTEDEVAVAKKQIANDLERRMKEPAYWLGQLSELNYRGHTLEELKQVPEIFQRYTADDLRRAFRKYLSDERIIRFVVVPAAGPSEKGTEPTPARDKRAAAAG